MNFKLIKLLAVVCGVLIVVIVAEWQFARYSKKQLFTQSAAGVEQDYAPGELPQIELAQQPEDSYVELTNRPLFVEGRRPVMETEEESEQVVVPLEKFDWELDGVFIHQDMTIALFSRSKKTPDQDNHLKKTEGETIDGWKLLEIDTDKVVLEQGGKRHELMLRKPKPTQLPPQSKPPHRTRR